MRILLIGVQRSGTTLLRRLMQTHPQITRIFHESFLLKKYKTKAELMNKFIKKWKLNDENKNWGEKVPYFPNLRSIPVSTYCGTWNSYFGDQSRILHIIRHPYDCALSNVKKFKYVKSPEQALGIYNNSLNKSLNAKIENVYTFKYEDMVLNPDVVIPKIFSHCGLKSDVDFRKLMKTWANPKYKEINSSRAFAYKKTKVKFKKDMSPIVERLNQIEGPKYEL